jgi:trans-2-enoyl-CoA reductase
VESEKRFNPIYVYGTPRVVSNQPGTKVVVTSDSGRALSIRVTVAKGTPAGVHTFTLTFAHGQRTLALYTQH